MVVNCMHPPGDHSYVKDNYLYCERCHFVCSHHTDMKGKDEQRYFEKMRKRTIFCRGEDGHNVKKQNLDFDRDNQPSCKTHPDKTWRWKVISVRGK